MAAELAATRSETATSDRIGSPGDDVRAAARVLRKSAKRFTGKDARQNKNLEPAFDSIKSG
jgi:hypothetical protein